MIDFKEISASSKYVVEHGEVEIKIDNDYFTFYIEECTFKSGEQENVWFIECDVVDKEILESKDVKFEELNYVDEGDFKESLIKLYQKTTLSNFGEWSSDDEC